MFKYCRFLGALAFLTTTVPAPASIVFSDSTFDLQDYSISVLQTGGATINYSQSLILGNPGPALQVTTFAPASSIPLTSREYFINNTFLYDPSVHGAALSISYSSDNFGLRDAGTQPPWGAALVIVQSGSYFLYSEALPATYGAWVSGGADNLLAEDFDLLTNLNSLAVDTTQHPSFASAMLFGTATGFSPSVPLASTWERRVDNFRIEISTAVPEPSTLLLLLLTVPLLFGMRHISSGGEGDE
jgi:hypothetical protein